MTYQPHAEPPQPGPYGRPANPYGNSQGPYGPPQQGSYGNPAAGSYGNPGTGSYGTPQQGPYGTPQQNAHGTPQQDSPGTPPPSFGPPAPQPPKKRKKWPWILLAVVVVMILGCVGIFTLFVGGAKEAVETLDDNAAGRNAVAGEMNKAARDGKFEFTVKSMDCARSTVGPSVLPVHAQGTFCVVTVTVKNIGDEAQYFDGSSQKAYDAKGTQFSDNVEAEVAINGDTSTFLQQINPGNQVTGKLVYDVPKGTKLTSIELHDSMFSGGVKIPLK